MKIAGLSSFSNVLPEYNLGPIEPKVAGPRLAASHASRTRTAGTFPRGGVLSPHLEHQLAFQVTRLADPMGFHGRGKIIERDVRRTDGPCEVKFGNALEMRPVTPDRRP